MFKRKCYRFIALIILSALLLSSLVGCSGEKSYDFTLGQGRENDDDDDKKFEFDWGSLKDKDKENSSEQIQDDSLVGDNTQVQEFTEAKQRVAESISGYFSMSDNSKKIIDSIIADSSEEEQIAHSFEKEHVNSLEIKEIKKSSESMVLEITAPDFVKIISGISDTEKQYISNIEDMSTLIKSRIIDSIESGNYKTVTKTVTVNIIQDIYGNTQIERSNEYLDAIYGGLLSYYIQYMDEYNKEVAE